MLNTLKLAGLPEVGCGFGLTGLLKGVHGYQGYYGLGCSVDFLIQHVGCIRGGCAILNSRRLCFLGSEVSLKILGPQRPC